MALLDLLPVGGATLSIYMYIGTSLIIILFEIMIRLVLYWEFTRDSLS